MSLAWNSTTSWVNGLCCFWPCWLHIWSHCSCFYSFFIIFAFSWAFSLHGKVHNKIFFLFIFYHCQICFLAYISGRVSAKFHNVFCLYFLWLFQPHCDSTFLLFVVYLSCPMHRAPNWQLCMTYFIFLFHQFTVFVLLFFSFHFSASCYCLSCYWLSAAVCFSISFEDWSKIHSVPPQSFT